MLIILPPSLFWFKPIPTEPPDGQIPVVLCIKWKPNRSELCAVADMRVWYQSRKPEQHKTLHLCREVCQSERQAAGPQSPGAPLWARILFLHPPSPSPPFSLLLSHPFLLLSHSYLFPIDQIQAKTRRAIYRGAVLFYLLVSICGTQKYRGLPGCWRQQCSAAERWREYARQRDRKE